MIKRKIKRITLYSKTDDLPENVTKLIDWLDGLLDAVPSDLRKDVEIDICSWDGCLETDIGYDRPETDSEMSARAEASEQAKEKRRMKQETAERAQLAELKRKYPNV